MKRLFGFSSVFTKISLLAFLVCVLCVSCNNSAKPAAQKQGGDTTPAAKERYGMTEFESIIGDAKQINQYILVDVRSVIQMPIEADSFEYQKGHTFCGVSIPFDNAKFDAKVASKDDSRFTDKSIFDSTLLEDKKDKIIIVQCRTHNRAPKVRDILKARGFTKVGTVFGTAAYAGPHTKAEGDDKGKSFNKNNFTRIPAVLKSQIKNFAGVKVLDVRSKADYDAGTYQEGSVKAEHCADPSKYKIESSKQVVVIAANAIDAFKAAKQIRDANSFNDENKLGSNQELLTKSPIRICVEPAK